MEKIIPAFFEDAFNCPLCGAFAHMSWYLLERDQFEYTKYYEAECSRCQQSSLWQQTSKSSKSDRELGVLKDEGILIFPDNGIAILPEEDMPEDVKKDYNEAARIYSRSPRASAALLRLGLQKICKHLGEKGDNINDDIRSLASKDILSSAVIKVADTVRITGNNAVHPGEMADEDIDYIASKMFYLLNFIVKKAISEPKELENLYTMIPEPARKAAETKDAKAKSKNPPQ